MVWFSSYSLVPAFFSLVHGAYRWPNRLIDELEFSLYEDTTLSSLVTNCGPDAPNSNDSLSADWIRFAFHDMATHNVDDGTGGLDASIWFELDRAENEGQALSFFSQGLFAFFGVTNKYVSRADITALGLVLGVLACDGPFIPFRGGRIDARKAGPLGVPQPHESLKSHTESFRRQGFSATEMIQLVACGHTLGGVKNPEFPQLNPIPPPPGGVSVKTFDTTEKFDHLVVSEYLDGTTQNPLVISSNKTLTSDLRIFSSDGNKTVKGMNSQNAFNKTCGRLLERMINTVPKTVTLTNVIEPNPFKVSSVQLTVGNGTLNFTASLRLTYARENPKRTVQLLWSEHQGTRCSRSTCSVTGMGQSISSIQFARLGVSPSKYLFNTAIDASSSISQFWFEVDEHDGHGVKKVDNGGHEYQIEQDQILYSPLRSSCVTNDTIQIVTAVKSTATPSRVYAQTYDNGIGSGTDFAIREATVELVRDASFTPTAGYDFYSGKLKTDRLNFTLDVTAITKGKQVTDYFKLAPVCH